MATKDECFEEVSKAERILYKCLLCKRTLSSKQRVLNHLYIIHRMSPVKKIKKLYVDDTSTPVPRRTKRRWKQKKSLISRVEISLSDSDSESTDKTEILKTGTADESSVTEMFGGDMTGVESCNYSEVPDTAEVIGSEDNIENKSGSSSYDTQDSYDDSLSEISSGQFSDTSNCSNTEFDEEDYDKLLPEANTISDRNEHIALNILGCFQRNNLSGAACKDILQTMGSAFPSSKHVLDFNYIQSFVGKQTLKEIHYCEICSCVFPDNKEIFRCSTIDCLGLRFKGALTQQQKTERQPRRSFIIADIKKQLEDLIQTQGITHEIHRRKADIQARQDNDDLTDITDGIAYRELLHSENNILKYPLSLTGIINTDGVNLYSSSKIELWPAYLAINELSPNTRFSRENMLLIALWQGKGKPPFKLLFEHLAEDLNHMSTVGTEIEINGCLNVVTLSVVCGTFDLPAKASILNMTYYNGKESCIACEDPGKRVKQGKGSSQCYPYRKSEDCYPARQHETVLQDMVVGTEVNRVKGFKGTSGISNIKTYDLVKGTVPDYMHCILLGVTNTLLNKWFSPSNSGQPFFIGKHIRKVSDRLCKIKPPISIERLPRDLEKHFQHLKATELQAWLLFYCIPCLINILPLNYLQHVAHLSEAVYILLGDNISTQMINRADFLLESFYKKFEDLYGSGSCGLNMHNACRHIIDYVKLWGPIWGWSCFPFEDANAMLLQSTHGTGNVMKQVMRHMETKSNLRKKGINKSRSNIWKVTSKAINCDICGKLKPLKPEIVADGIVDQFELNSVKQLDRISVNGKQFCSIDYNRMEKRICYVVLCENEKVGSILAFLLDQTTNRVFAVLQLYEIHVCSDIDQLQECKHLIPVRIKQQKEIVLAEKLLDTLLFIDVSEADNLHSAQYVVVLPNRQGHAILK